MLFILFTEIAILGVVFTSILGLILKRLIGRGIEVGGPRLVLRRFEVAEAGADQADGTGANLIRIKGRATGLVSLALTRLGLENTVSFIVDRQGASLRGVSLNGKFKHEIPLRCVESTMAAYAESVWSLILGAIVGLLAVVRCALYAAASNGSAAAGSIVIGALFVGCYLLYHHFSKRLLLGVTAGGEKVGVAFQRGVLGSMPIDFVLVERAIGRLDREILGRDATRATPSGGSAANGS